MVRYAEEKDLPQVNVIRRQVSELHVQGRPDIFKPGFCQELQDRVYDYWREENSGVIVVEREGVICGMASVEYIDKPESPYNNPRRIYHIVEFGVDAAYRRRGVGRELMDFIQTDAKAKDCGSIELDMWSFNETAEKFYESIGFRTFRKYMELKTEE